MIRNRVIFLGLAVVLCTACAHVWQKPDGSGTPGAFAEDKYACMQEAPATVGFGVYGMLAASATQQQYFRACMNARGWVLVRAQ